MPVRATKVALKWLMLSKPTAKAASVMVTDGLLRSAVGPGLRPLFWMGWLRDGLRRM
jgi:hypothetical protein